jgi:O-antigen ligase
MELFGDRPIFGYGMGSSNTLIRAQSWRFVRFQGLHFHSSYIMALVETGVLGFLVLMATLITTFARGLADARRTRMLPRELWPTAALPFAMFAGALGHALFESWLLAGGNVNAPMFWIVVWLIHFQPQVRVRRVVKSPPRPSAPAQRLAIPSR